MQELEERLFRWRRAGLITSSQADAIRAYEQARPRPGPAPAAPRYVAPAPAPPPGRPLPRPQASLRSLARVQDRSGPLLKGLPAPAPDGRLVGLGMALLGAAGVLTGIFWVTLDVLSAPTHSPAGDLEDLLHLGASLLGAVGGFRMAIGSAAGRRLVLGSLGINVAATVILSFRRLLEFGTGLEVLLWIALGVVVAAATFDRSAPAVQG